ncbi:MAG: aminotransferase class I/II-fold pyridoxal phosphate-dependent enzyme [Actinomycetota bacterium]|nr:aminotransferase class I/II-fold pyridoxal phosphate-dependent enzyme [Actinomycetota bacterium]
MIDLRSDTVTRPTEAMRAAMVSADVGDDVYGEDPTVRLLEERVAAMFGHEAALFTVTGSLANLLAVRSVVPVGTEVLCEARAHIARAELGAHAALSGTTMRTWTGPGVELAAIEAMIAPDLGPFMVRTAALSVENTHNFGGGAVLPIEDLRALRALADTAGVAVHLDGARIWNAHVATGTPLRDYGAVADVLMVSLSKGLGAPVGSALVGTAETIAGAREWRKRLGGGWRQAGMLAAAGLHALDHHVERLADDHHHARQLAEAAGIDPQTVATNMVVVDCDDAPALVERLRAGGVLAGAVGPRAVRLVTHLDVDDADTARAAEVLAKALAG